MPACKTAVEAISKFGLYVSGYRGVLKPAVRLHKTSSFTYEDERLQLEASVLWAGQIVTCVRAGTKNRKKFSHQATLEISLSDIPAELKTLAVQSMVKKSAMAEELMLAKSTAPLQGP